MANYKVLVSIDPKTFAFKTFSERIPIIITSIINNFYKHHLNKKLSKVMKGDYDLILSNLSKLKSDIQRNKEIEFDLYGQKDEEAYRRHFDLIKQQGFPMKWFDAPWLFAECVMYRKVHQIFLQAASFASFDYFALSKIDSLMESIQSIQSLCNTYCDELENEAFSLRSFQILMHKCLWGNKTDLSLSAGSTASVALNQSNSSLDCLLDDCTFDIFQRFPVDQLDIIADNSGFELFTDLLLSIWLIQKDSVKNRVVMHLKSIPWFVSDTTLNDVDMIKCLHAHLPGNEKYERVFTLINEYIESSKIVFKHHWFWTCSFDFSRLPDTAPELYSEISQSNMIILKGDLNYRKTCMDIECHCTTPWVLVLSELNSWMLKASNIVLIRTLKSEPLVGIKDEKRIPSNDPSFRVNGKYGVIQLIQ